MRAQAVVTALGVWLMFAADLLPYDGAAQTNLQIVGPLVVTFGFIAMWQIARSLRWINLALGVWLALSAFWQWNDVALLVHSMIVGALIAGLSLVRGKLDDRVGGGWTMLWRSRQAAST